MSYNLPNPSLVGILLVVSTHNGPQIVYHYPPELSKQELLRFNQDEEAPIDDDFDDEDYEEVGALNKELGDMSSGDQISLPLLRMSGLSSRRSEVASFRHGRTNSTISENKRLNSETTKPIKSQILGFEPEVIAEMLSPPREMCNCRFDLLLESMVFSGLPIHVLPDGSWKSHKSNSRRAGPKSESGHVSGHVSGNVSGVSANGNVSGNASTNLSALAGPGSFPPMSEDDVNKETEMTATPTTSRRPMSMFHLVFIMNPPKIERSYRTDEMFYYVILKLLFVLRYEQHKRGYVWEQVKMISRLKEEYFALATDERNESLSDYLLAGLLLCKLMSQCYTSLVSSRIARLIINNKLHSFQIPLKMEFNSLPEVSTPYVPGSYLSSTTSIIGESGLIAMGETTRYSGSSLLDQFIRNKNNDDDQDDDLDEDEYLTSSDELLHLGLLLWDDPDSIIEDMKAKKNSPISTFIHMIRPTESLLKMFSRLELQYHGKMDLTIANIRDLALHLVHWRKARMILPLNMRGIYIVSPMAPIGSRFQRDIVRFNQHFPTIPSLPLFLKSLSTRSKKPRQFASIVPSKDHREIYLLALAWLVRYGYATQLHTYIWLKVSRKIKMKVEEELEAELGSVLTKEKEYNAPQSGNTDNKLTTSVDNSSKQASSKDTSNPGNSKNIEDEIGKLQKRFELSQSVPDILLEDDSDTILVDPGRATSLERRWINEIIHKECELSPELTAVFYKLLKYMNGRNLLEILLLKEDITRAELRKLLLSIESHVISVRHW